MVDRDEEVWAVNLDHANLALIAIRDQPGAALLIIQTAQGEMETWDLAGKTNSKTKDSAAVVEIPTTFVNLALNANLKERLVRENTHKVEYK